MGVSLVPQARLEQLAELARSVDVPGAVAEIGVYRGGSAELLARALPDRELHLFDTFEGLPKPGPLDGPHCKRGRFDAPAAEVLRRVPRAIIHQGRVHSASTHIPRIPYAFVHVDVDLFVSTFDVLMQFYPLMIRGGILFVDDYGGEPTPGATKAVDVFMRCTPENLVAGVAGGAWFRRE